MSFKLKSCDGQEVIVKLQEPLQDYMQGIVEVHGRVEGNAILASNYISFDSDQTNGFDMTQYNKAIELAQRFPACYKMV
ncbi:replication protein A 14 kDa subunit-like isoform X2 [Lineus longissimus]